MFRQGGRARPGAGLGGGGIGAGGVSCPSGAAEGLPARGGREEARGKGRGTGSLHLAIERSPSGVRGSYPITNTISPSVIIPPIRLAAQSNPAKWKTPVKTPSTGSALRSLLSPLLQWIQRPRGAGVALSLAWSKVMNSNLHQHSGVRVRTPHHLGSEQEAIYRFGCRKNDVSEHARHKVGDTYRLRPSPVSPRPPGPSALFHMCKHHTPVLAHLSPTCTYFPGKSSLTPQFPIKEIWRPLRVSSSRMALPDLGVALCQGPGANRSVIRVGALSAPPAVDVACFKRFSCRHIGYDLELIAFLARALGCSLDVVQPPHDAYDSVGLNRLLDDGKVDMLASAQPIEDRPDRLYSQTIHQYYVFYLGRRPRRLTQFHFLAGIFQPTVWACILASLALALAWGAFRETWPERTGVGRVRAAGRSLWRVWATALKQPPLRGPKEAAVAGLSGLILLHFMAMVQSQLTADVRVLIRVTRFEDLVEELASRRLRILLDPYENTSAPACPTSLEGTQLCSKSCFVLVQSVVWPKAWGVKGTKG